MPKIQYDHKSLRASKLALIDQANEIIEGYQAQGYKLTLRQLYYQFVARDLIPNKTQSYKALGAAVSDGRICGLIDWDAIEDRTRNLESNPHWDDPAEILEASAEHYRVDHWEYAPVRVEVWVEKEALAGVVERPALRLDVPFFCCKGYVSQSEQWAAGRRMRRYRRKGQSVVILHLGDHDPSGIDMTRDITSRLAMFAETYDKSKLKIQRIALNMDQVEELGPPPNPAKMTDSRFNDYAAMYGDESWELDALPPEFLDALIERHIRAHMDQDVWDQAAERQQEGRDQLRSFIDEL